MSALLQLAIVAAAVAAWLVSPSPSWVEQFFWLRTYPTVQAAVTTASNTVGLPLFDLVVILLLAGVSIGWIYQVRLAWRQRRAGPLLTGARFTLVIAAGLYLWFLGAWGLNYRRVPIEATSTFDASRVTAAAVRALAMRAVTETNRRYQPAHQVGFPPLDTVPAALVAALHRVEFSLGRSRPTVPALPKNSLLTPFFRAAGVDGMLAPFLLETLLNPDLTGPERPAVLAHEWAHLSGYAPEDEASFVGILAALDADTPSQYSGWLALVFDTAALLSTPERQQAFALLDEGPRRDQQAIVDRLLRRIDVVQRASWVAYDGYLKSQGVDEGIHSYSGVVRLLIGTGAEGLMGAAGTAGSMVRPVR